MTLAGNIAGAFNDPLSHFMAINSLITVIFEKWKIRKLISKFEKFFQVQ